MDGGGREGGKEGGRGRAIEDLDGAGGRVVREGEREGGREGGKEGGSGRETEDLSGEVKGRRRLLDFPLVARQPGV